MYITIPMGIPNNPQHHKVHMTISGLIYYSDRTKGATPQSVSAFTKV